MIALDMTSNSKFSRTKLINWASRPNYAIIRAFGTARPTLPPWCQAWICFFLYCIFTVKRWERWLRYLLFVSKVSCLNARAHSPLVPRSGLKAQLLQVASAFQKLLVHPSVNGYLTFCSWGRWRRWWRGVAPRLSCTGVDASWLSGSHLLIRP